MKPTPRANQKAFNSICGLCHWPKRSVAVEPLPTAKLLGFKYINYRVCDWCDKRNKGKRS